MHPRFEIEREYAVRVVGELSTEQIAKLKTGIMLEDGIARCESVKDEGGEGSNHWYHIVLKEGRNRIVRRMFEALGLTVSRLMRVRFGIVALPPRLKRGQFIELTADETRRLLAWQQVPEGGTANATSCSRVRRKTQSSPPLVSGQIKADRGKAASTRLRLCPTSTTSSPSGFRCCAACAQDAAHQHRVRRCRRPARAPGSRRYSGGQPAHDGGPDIRRVGDDQVVTLVPPARKTGRI